MGGGAVWNWKGNNLISLVIPVRNEAATMAGLWETIQAQTLSPDEIIIVDGGSDDATVAMYRRLFGDDKRVRIIETLGATPGKGRNIGIGSAVGDWIALTDAGIRLDPDWLERLAEVARKDPSIGVVYGNYEPVIDTYFERCAALAYVALKQERPGGRMRGPSIASCLIKKSVWEAVGGFPDSRAAEDLIFMRRVEESGFGIGWAPRATVWWQLRPDLMSTFRKFALYSRHNVWAGMQRYWHYGIARQYAVYLGALALMVLHSAWWGLVPLVGFGARTMKSIWVRREGRGLWWTFHPLQFLGVTGVLLTIDAATFVGWIQAKAQGKK